jgi:hypothetical protein
MALRILGPFSEDIAQAPKQGLEREGEWNTARDPFYELSPAGRRPLACAVPGILPARSGASKARSRPARTRKKSWRFGTFAFRWVTVPDFVEVASLDAAGLLERAERAARVHGGSIGHRAERRIMPLWVLRRR